MEGFERRRLTSRVGVAQKFTRIVCVTESAKSFFLLEKLSALPRPRQAPALQWGPTPISPSPQRYTTDTWACPRSMTDSRRKVLLVDDEKFLLEIYSIKFLRRGFDVFACGSADEAITTLEKGYEPDVIVFDITMPHKSGYEFLEELQYLKLAKHALKVALTNESQEAEMRRTKELGAVAHLVKARFTAGEVVDQVELLLEKNHSLF